MSTQTSTIDDKVLLAKCLTLKVREARIPNIGDNSNDLIRTALEKVAVGEVNMGINAHREMILSIKKTILDLCAMPADEEIDINGVLQRIRISTENDERFYDTIEKSLKEDLTDSMLRRSVTSIVQYLHRYFKEQTLAEVLKKNYINFVFKRDSVKDVAGFVAQMIAELEPLQMTAKTKDPAVISEVDLSSHAAVLDVFNTITDPKGMRVYQTGWDKFNKFAQGGFRKGISVSSALQHKYKTGFNLSSFAHAVMFNTPYTNEPGKKPLAIRISFEDTVEENLKFLYTHLKYSEERVTVSMEGVTPEMMSEFVMSRLNRKGFHVLMLHVDPSQWTYRSIFNKINELEAEGYVIELLWLDYLAMLPRTGCVGTIAGEDTRDLLRRTRNFCLAKGIACHTPHQMSVDALNLIRGGTPEHLFVKEVAEKNYYDGSKKLGQDIDLEIFLHLFKHNKDTWLALQRGKHRISAIIDNDDWKNFFMLFPKKGMPIPYDKDEENTEGVYKLPSRMVADSGDSNFF